MYNGKFKIVAALMIVAGFLAGMSFLRSEDTGPNVILISVDTLRADHLGCYGYERSTTPNIDQFAKDGILFVNAIAQSSWTLPSHLSLFTSLYPSSHGVISKEEKLNEKHITLAEVLQGIGYETVAFTDGGYVKEKFGYQGFDHFESNRTGKEEYGIEVVYTKAVNWLKGNHSKPFFLFLHTYQPHSPYDPLPPFDIYSDKNYNGIVDVSAGQKSDYYEGIKSEMTREDYQYVIDKYDGEILYTDHFIGKLFEELRRLGLYDKSVIILTSDHGENFMDHTDSELGFIGHYELYDEIVKVPLIIKAPELPTGKVINAQAESIDIMPTVLDLLEINIHHKVDGGSLMGLIEHGSYDDVFAFSERSLSPNREFDEYKMIRSNDWKLLLRLRNSPDPSEMELYNLKVDPKEQNNLFTEEAEVGKLLLANLQSWMDTQKEKSKKSSADKIQLDKESIEELKALGYIN